MSFVEQWIENIKKNYGDLGLTSEAATPLISAFQISLSKSVFAKATRVIETLFDVSRTPRSPLALTSHQLQSAQCSNAPPSVLMAYDFHLDLKSDRLKLIEINTNAAGFLIAHSIAQFRGLADNKPIQSLKNSFASAARYKNQSPFHCAIVDVEPEQQKMFLEFQLYSKLFSEMGWTCEILDSSNLIVKNGSLYSQSTKKKIDFVYNRTTDFYFDDPKHESLRKAYLENLCPVSPNPREYFLLADKDRYAEWATDPQPEWLKDHFIPTFSAQSRPAEDIWAERKHLFFKPKLSHGGKSVYKAESVSRKVFERVIQDNFLVQHYTPAGEVIFNESTTPWKFDLRFYVFDKDIQFWCARVYQGQVTNFRTPGGGFCPVVFT